MDVDYLLETLQSAPRYCGDLGACSNTFCVGLCGGNWATTCSTNQCSFDFVFGNATQDTFRRSSEMVEGFVKTALTTLSRRVDASYSYCPA